MATYSADIQEVGAVEDYLERVNVAFRREAVKRAVGAVCAVVRDAARERVPVDKGTLRSRMGYVVREYEGAIVGVVGEKIEGREQAYGHIVEFGRTIQTSTGDRRRAFANPFFRRAIDETDLDQEAALIVSLSKDLPEA